MGQDDACSLRNFVWLAQHSRDYENEWALADDEHRQEKRDQANILDHYGEVDAQSDRYEKQAEQNGAEGRYVGFRILFESGFPEDHPGKEST